MTLDRAARFGDAAAHLVPLVARHATLAAARVVEFGCGSGPVAEAFARHGASVLGVEIDEQAVAEGRALLAGTDLEVDLVAGTFPMLLERVLAERGRVDVVLFPAVLEHMTHAERLAALRTARDVLRPGGVVALFETPNRLLPWDHHTTQTPFFHLLPDEMALAWLPNVRRRDVAEEIDAAPNEAGRRLALARAGRAVSFHELDVAWPDGWTALDGGYDPALAPIRLVHAEERALWQVMERMPLEVHPAFSRYWLDVVLRPESSGGPPGVQWRPIAFEAIDRPAAGVTRWETLLLGEPGATVALEPGYAFDAVVVGVEPRADAAQCLHVAGADAISVAPGAATAYATVELRVRAQSFLLTAGTPGLVLSHVAVRTTG